MDNNEFFLDVKNLYYKLDDGRIYGVEFGGFVDNTEEEILSKNFNASIVSAPDKLGKNSETGLKEALQYYHIPIGIDLKTIEEVRAEKLAELNEKWLNAEQHGKIDSSLGFKIDATERSLRDVNGLIDTLTLTQEPTTEFCDANNEFQTVSLENLKKMKFEILEYGQQLYKKKWTFRNQINSSDNKNILNSLEIKFD